MQDRKRNQINSIFSQFFGLFILMTLFALAEFSPETIADQKTSLIGVWSGANNSTVPTTIYLEDDQSFTWLKGTKRLMSGDYELGANTLKLKFGDAPEETLTYDYKMRANGELSLKQGSFEYVLRKTVPSR